MAKNKKAIKTFAAAALVTSALVPVASASAATTYSDVVVTVNGELVTISQAEYNLASALGKAPSLNYLKVDGKYYAKSSYDLQVALGKADPIQALVTDATASNITPKTGSVDGSGNVVTTPPVTGDLKVESVSAINANNAEQTLPATDVVANSKFEVKFNKDVDAATVTTGTIYLTQDGVKQLATVSYNATKNTATLTLNAGAQLTPGKAYVLTVDGVKNAEGVAVAKSTTNFTVSNSPIISSAKNSAAADLEGSIVTGPSQTIDLVFNKDIDKNTLNTTNIKLYNITKSEYVPVTLLSILDKSVKVTAAALVSGDDYRLEITNGVKDLAGNALAATSYNFFYGISAPTVSNHSPAKVGPGNLNVYNKVTASAGNDAFKFRAQFSAAVDAATVNGSTVKLVDKVAGTTVDATVTYETGSRYVVVTPLADLKENTQYEVTIDGVKTDKGIKVGKDVTTFTTGDFTVPTIVSSTPANAADGVAVDGTFTVNFSEKMSAASLALGTGVILEDVTVGAATPITTGFANWTSSLSQDGKTLTVKPSAGAKLDPNKTYRLTVKKTATDVASPANPLSEDYKVLFNTQAAAATVLSSVQTGTTYATTNTKVETGVTNVTDTNNLFFNFDKDLKPTLGSYKIEDLVKVEKLESNGTYTALTTKASAAASGEVLVTLESNNKTIKVTAPDTVNWTKDNTYRVTVPTSVKDVNGNDVQNTVFSFTTGTKPTVDVTNSSPANFATGVAVKTPYLAVVINDAESALQNSSLNSDNVKVVKKSDGSAAPYSIDSTNYTKKTVTQTAAATTGTKTVTTSATSNLVAGDIITIVGTAGTHVVTNVSGVTVTVDKDIATTVTGGAITVHQGVVFKLNTDAKLAGNTDYQIQVKNVLDAAGNKADDKTIAFKTATDEAKLEFVSSSIADGSTGVKVDSSVELTFNEKVTDATLASITLAGTGIGASDYTVTRKADNDKVVVITPKGFLKDSNTVYTVTVPATVASTGGVIGTAKTISFQTEATASVKPKVTSALYFDQDGSGTVNQGDKVIVSFNSAMDTTVVLDGSTVEADNGFKLDLTGGTLGISNSEGIAWAADGKSVSITLGSSPTLIPGSTKLGLQTVMKSASGIAADTITLVTITK